MRRILAIAGGLACLSSLLFILLWPEVSQGGQLTPQERRGKQIYLRGVSPSGRQIAARVGNSSLEVPAATLPCANCHGLGGRGTPEAGIIPSDITWQTLTKPYGVTSGSGRKHPAYGEPLLARAITDGLDAAGNPLGLAMPRYRIPGADLADLVAYLKRLGSEQDPGLRRDEIVLGTILPGPGPLSEIGRVMQAVMEATFEEINGQGGIYDRKIRFRVIRLADTPSTTRSSVERTLERDPVFAMVGAFIGNAEQEIYSLAEREELPLVGPFTLFPPDRSPLNRYVFSLLAGLKEQARALVEFAAQRQRAAPSRVAIIFPAEAKSRSIAESVEEQCGKHEWVRIRKVEFSRGGFDAARVAEEAARDGAETIFFLGSGEEAQALMRAAARISWSPGILLPGLLTGPEIFEAPADFRDKLFLAYPTLPSDQTRDGIEEYRRLAVKHRLPTTHLTAQLSAYAAVQILVEGLKRAGKDVSREKLITTLEGLYQFQTGLTPPITYGPNQRIGALGAYIVPVDLEQKRFGAAGEWMPLE